MATHNFLPIIKMEMKNPSDLSVIDAQDNNFQQDQQEYPLKLTSRIDDFIQEFGTFPEYSLIIGICDDGLPLILDLSSPRPGAILVYRISDYATSEIINSICLAGMRLNPPENLGVCIIADDPDEYLDLAGYPHTQAMLAPFEKSAGNMVLELSAIAEQRRYGRELGQAILLVIDDLYSFLSYNTDYGVMVNLKWLVNYGPRSMIWPLFTIRDSNISKFNQSLISLFPFRITSTRMITPGSSSRPGQTSVSQNRFAMNAMIGSRNLPFYPLTK